MRNKMFALLICILLYLSVSGQTIYGNGDRITKKIPVLLFNNIEFGENITGNNTFGKEKQMDSKTGSPIFYYYQNPEILEKDNSRVIEITMDQNLFEHLHVNVNKDQKLRICAEGEIKIAPTHMIIKAESKDLQSVHLYNGGNFVIKTSLHLDSLKIVAEKAYYVRIDKVAYIKNCKFRLEDEITLFVNKLICTEIEVDLLKNSILHLKGKALKARFNARGASTIKASNFIVKDYLNVSAHEGSNMSIHVIDTLSGGSFGSNVRFKKGIKHLVWIEK